LGEIVQGQGYDRRRRLVRPAVWPRLSRGVDEVWMLPVAFAGKSWAGGWALSQRGDADPLLEGGL
jgi:hypothetical protein